MADLLARLQTSLADRYTIERELGAGGMATVYLAEDLRHHRQVALKVLRPELAEALGPERFLREIDTTARLAHPHILPLHDSGEAAGFLYYVMPYVEGESLRDRLTREKQVPLDDALRVTREVADALSYAHSHGVVHRDIKPENILLQSGLAVVADFGIAKAIAAVGSERLTETGLTLGTPQYMSPEQAAGSQDLDGRSDLYSLGCVLYEMLAGQPPFTGATAESVVRQHLAAEPPNITVVRPTVPTPVAAALLRALAKAPADRFTTAAQFAEALTLSPLTQRSQAGGARPWARRVAVLMVGLIAVAAAWLAFRNGVLGTSRRPSVAILLMDVRSRTAGDTLLAEGLTLEIINTLSRVARLDVRSRWVSRRIAADADPMRGARAVGVDYLVDGVLEVDSARVLVRGALTRTSTGGVVQSLRVDRRRTELEGLQVAVAEEVAAAVVGRLLPAELARFTVQQVDPRVTELLLGAGALFQQYTLAEARQALGLVRQAIAIDSTYAPAWVLLDWIYTQISLLEPDSFGTYAQRSEAAAARAFALDSSNGKAMSDVAAYRMYHNDLSPRTEALARRGAALEPGVETAIDLTGVLLGMGKVDEALSNIRASARRDSLSPAIWAGVAIHLALARRFAEAAGAWERALALRPSAPDSLSLAEARRWARLEAKDCAGSLADGRTAGDLFLVIESLRCQRRTAEADSIIDSRLALSTVAPAPRAIFLAWRNQPDSAFAILDRTFPPMLGLTIQHPAFAPYRRHPAYLALRRRMGLER